MGLRRGSAADDLYNGELHCEQRFTDSSLGHSSLERADQVVAPNDDLVLDVENLLTLLTLLALQSLHLLLQYVLLRERRSQSSLCAFWPAQTQ